MVTRTVREDLVTRSVSEEDRGWLAVQMSDGECTAAPSLTRRVTIEWPTAN